MDKIQRQRSLNAAVHKLQLSLLDGVETLDLLYLAGTVISRSDYNDVVTERTIADLCGYPLCPNALPPQAARPTGGRYRVSLSQHKVYDRTETSMYCSSRCLIDSKAFAQSVAEERCDALDFGKVERVLSAFGDGRVAENCVKEIGDDLGISKLKIEEKSENYTGNIEGWAGPSNAIEGYVPKKDRTASKPLPSNKSKQGYSKGRESKGKDKKTTGGGGGGNTLIINDMDFMGTLMACNEYSNEYSVSKMPPSVAETRKLEESRGKAGGKDSESGITVLESSVVSDKSEVPSISDGVQTVRIRSAGKEKDECFVERKAEKSSEANLRSSLKHSGAKKLNRSVTWADGKSNSSGSKNLCEVRDMEDPDAFGSLHKPLCKPSVENEAGSSFAFVDEKIDTKEVQDTKEIPQILGISDWKDNELFESAEACAIALSQAAGAVASGGSDVNKAVAEAGIIILPRQDGVDEEESIEDDTDEEEFSEDIGDEEDSADDDELEHAPEKWPTKPGNQDYNLFNPEDSFFDAPPEGFSLTLSPFATMYNALFAWITSSTLAYIYGKDDSFHEEFLFVNERGYPHKIALADGRSTEIQQTMGGSLSRAFPEIAADMGLPKSSIEKGMAYMLNTMTFTKALPAFRMKQWQVIALLFIEGLSICRIPTLASHMTNRRVLIQKVLDGAHISIEQYEVMKELLIPLGRAPQFSSQSGA